jgi:phenylacetate-CoA ligase
MLRATDHLHVATYLIAAMRSQWWSADRIRRYQDQALRRILQHAVRHVPFYQRLGIRAESIAGSADLHRFPIIRKLDIQREPEAFLATGLDPRRLRSSRTSGSSGQPTITYFDASAWLRSKYALKMRRVAATAGLRLRQRVLIVSETPPSDLPRLANAAPRGFGLVYNVRYLSIHTPSEEHLALIEEYRPHVVYAFPSYLLDLITAAEERGVKLPQIDTLCTSSEVLTPAVRDRVEASFRGRLFDVYGSTEFKEIAWQCQHGRYHLNFETVHVESVAPGTVGPVVVSSLCNYAMPLVRFDIGDRAMFAPNDCACGRATPQFVEFLGREGDMITLPGGRRVSPYVLTTVIEAEDSILQYRIVETSPGTFRLDVVVRTPGASAAWATRMAVALRRLAGKEAAFTVREVGELPPDSSGKRSVFHRAPDGCASGADASL